MTKPKRWTPWVIAAVVVALLGFALWRTLAQQRAQKAALAASATQSAVVMDITTDEVWPVRRQTLSLGVPVTGALRAVQSATIKARVAGELQGLSLREGDNVREGQEVARIEATEMQARLRQAQQQADAARAQVDISQRQFDNNRALVDQGFISRTALQTSQASLQAAQSSYQAALAAADLGRKALSDTVLRSPISGQVAQRLVQNGERVAVETRILEVVSLSSMEVEALLGPADSVAVRVGQSASLQLEGRSNGLNATVVRINPSAQAGSRAVPVYLAIDPIQTNAGSPPDALRQGLFVQGRIHTGTVQPLVVPLDAVRTDQPAPYVQVADNGKVTHQPVQTGVRSMTNGQMLVEVNGIAEGSLVLAGRVGMLPPGTALRLPTTAPAMTPVTAPAPAPAKP